MKRGKEFISLNSQIQITGNSQVLVDGCKKILEYNDIFVKVQTAELIVQIWGSELSVNDFGSDVIYVHGNIQSVELEKNR